VRFRKRDDERLQSVQETTHQTHAPHPIVIAVGGLDSSGGAGLLRDHLTGAALGAQMLLVGTAWTLQSAAGVRRIDPRPPDQLQQAVIEALAMAAGSVVAVKIGMVANQPQVGGLLAALDGFAGAVVLDPVLTASAGGWLFQGEPEGLLPLLRRATLATPNLNEAAMLSGRPVLDEEGALKAARVLVEQGAAGVLVKGGHLLASADDVLVWRPSVDAPMVEKVFAAPRIPVESPRGTGCALATAIAFGLASGEPLPQAVRGAKAWLRERIAAAKDVAGERHL
jgi:hydroxymethylpyrimidine/phosphomethylpyrimidine kinase